MERRQSPDRRVLLELLTRAAKPVLQSNHSPRLGKGNSECSSDWQSARLDGLPIRPTCQLVVQDELRAIEQGPEDVGKGATPVAGCAAAVDIANHADRFFLTGNAGE